MKPNVEVKLKIPEEHVLEVIRLYENHAVYQDKKTEYDLWAYIANIYPEVRSGGWILQFPNPFEIIIWRIRKE